MEMPPHMRVTPRDFQLKAAAQGLWCLAGPMKLFLLGDEMGVGKTLTSILIMWAMKDKPGMSLWWLQRVYAPFGSTRSIVHSKRYVHIVSNKRDSIM
jgi:hypothetical protein